MKTKKEAVKKTPAKKEAKKEIEVVISPKIVRPMVFETVYAEKREGNPVYSKRYIATEPTLEPGHIRCLVLVDYKGMTDDLYAGDIIDLPERRFKSLAFRGMVEEYKGDKPANRYR